MRRVLIALFLLLSLSAGASTYTVDDFGDAGDATPGDDICDTGSGVCTLRAAIEEAEAHSGADIIEFDTGGAFLPATDYPPITEQLTIDGTSASDYLGDPVVLIDGGNVATIGLHFNTGSDNSELIAVQISGYTIAGVVVDANAVTIRRSYLGPVIEGDPNLDGLQLNGNGSTIGGADGEGNVISANDQHGIVVSGANHVISDNFIGVDETGAGMLSNGEDGIAVSGTAGPLIIGSTTAGEENIISGNFDVGVSIDTGSGTVLVGNVIGLDVTGTVAIPNFIGVEVLAEGNTIGTTTRGNLISGNDDDGIDVIANDTIVHNNLIGPDASGLAGVGNFGWGIAVIDSSNVDIGGSAANEGNVLSFNGADGIFVLESDTSRITGNIIGLDSAGTGTLGNGGLGILLVDSEDLTIASNVISGNSEGGVVDAGGITNIIEMNRIGTTADGSAAAGNLGTGVEIFASVDTIVRGNVVSGNDGHGVETTFGSTAVIIHSNTIGRSLDLSTPMGNFGDGVNVCDGASDTVVGSVALGGNIISDNAANGIGVEPTALTNNTWAANQIFDHELLGIDIDQDGVTSNDEDDPDEGANNLQNFPELTFAVSTPTASQVLGTINTLPNTAFTIHFYSNSAIDPSGFGEGETYVGETSGTTDANGDAAFVFAGPAVTLGREITATATTDDGTSEFSAPVTVEEAPTVFFSSATYLAGEADGSTIITVQRSGNLNAISTVQYTTSNGTATAGSDYTTASGTLTFAVGDDTETFIVPITSDNTDESDEIVNLTLSNPTAATLGAQSTAQLTIADDDNAPTITIDDDTENEGTTLVFTVTLSNPSASDVTVNYTTANDTATAGSDYTAETSFVTITAGNLSTTIDITTTADTTFEPDETLFVNLTGATNGTITDNQAQGTITNDDAQPTVSIQDATAVEGGNLIFVVTLSNPSASAVTVNYSTADGTATAPNDYTADTNVATVFAGSLTTTIIISAWLDNEIEPDETMFVNLSGGSGATITDDQAVGTIEDTSTLPELSIEDDSGTEGTTITFTLTLSFPSGDDVTVNYTTADFTANAGSDYTAEAGTATITAGNTTTTIDIATTADLVFEPNEMFVVSLSGATNATFSKATGFGTILNDDGQPTVTIEDDSDTEGNALGFTVTLSNPSSGDVTVNYATADDTATAGSDYTAQSASVLITAGNTTATITIPTTVDTLPESDETFFVNLTGATNATIADNQAIGTILNNDTSADLNITKVASTPTFTAGQQITFTITVQNLGPSTATSLTVTDVLPAGTTFVSASGPAAVCSGTTTVTCTIASLANGASTPITLIVTANGSLPISNTATVAAAAPPDPTPFNNAAAATVVPTGIDEVPTMSQWALLLLAMALGFIAMRRT